MATGDVTVPQHGLGQSQPQPTLSKTPRPPFAGVAATTVEDGTGTMIPIGTVLHLLSVNGRIPSLTAPSGRL